MTDEYKREADLPDNSPVSSKRKPGVKWMTRGLILVALGLLGWMIGVFFLEPIHPKVLFFSDPSLNSLHEFWNDPNQRHVLILEFIIVALLLVGAIGVIILLVGVIILFIGIIRWIETIAKRIAAFIKSESTQKKVASFFKALEKMLNNAGTARHRLPFDEELRRLGKLKNEGHITEAEFEEAKKKILARIE